MNEELSILTHDFYSELLRVEGDKNYDMWVDATRISLEIMKIKQLEDINEKLNNIYEQINLLD